MSANAAILAPANTGATAKRYPLGSLEKFTLHKIAAQIAVDEAEIAALCGLADDARALINRLAAGEPLAHAGRDFKAILTAYDWHSIFEQDAKWANFIRAVAGMSLTAINRVLATIVEGK